MRDRLTCISVETCVQGRGVKLSAPAVCIVPLKALFGISQDFQFIPTGTQKQNFKGSSQCLAGVWPSRMHSAAPVPR